MQKGAVWPTSGELGRWDKQRLLSLTGPHLLSALRKLRFLLLRMLCVWGSQGSLFSELHSKSPSRWEPSHKCPSLGKLRGHAMGSAGDRSSLGSPCLITGWGAQLAPKVTQQCQSPVILAGLLLPAAGGENCPAAPVQAEHGSPAGSKVWQG